jgi:hypothetical protein
MTITTIKLDFVQKSTEVLRSVIPAQAGIQRRLASHQEAVFGLLPRIRYGAGFLPEPTEETSLASAFLAPLNMNTKSI